MSSVSGTLQELSLAYCGFSAEAVYALSNLIAHPRKLSGLKEINETKPGRPCLAYPQRLVLVPL